MQLTIVLFVSLTQFLHSILFFFFNDTPTTEIYTLSLHDALPISYDVYPLDGRHDGGYYTVKDCVTIDGIITTIMRSEERFSRNAETDLVCRLLLEKKKKTRH